MPVPSSKDKGRGTKTYTNPSGVDGGQINDLRTKFLLFKSNTDDLGAVTIEIKTEDYSVESREMFEALMNMVETIKGLKNKEGQSIEGLSLQKVEFTNSERPNGVTGMPIKIN